MRIMSTLHPQEALKAAEKDLSCKVSAEEREDRGKASSEADDPDTPSLHSTEEVTSLCEADSSTVATVVEIGLAECIAPVREELVGAGFLADTEPVRGAP